MPAPPAWLKRFTDDVCGCLHAIEAHSPIGCHYFENAERIEISLFVSPAEIVGGPHDGERLPGLFVLDALELMHLFDVVESVQWQPHPVSDQDELGAHLAVAGVVAGHRVTLQILSETPERFAPGLFANVLEQRLHDTWRS